MMVSQIRQFPCNFGIKGKEKKAQYVGYIVLQYNLLKKKTMKIKCKNPYSK